MSRLFQHFALAAAIAVAAAAPAHAADFLKAIEDVPIPKGMAESPEPVVFESDQGRVVRAHIQGNTPCKDITAFYASTLPALGWTRESSGMTYKRESEHLTLGAICDISDGVFRTIISFELVVKLASTRLAE